MKKQKEKKEELRRGKIILLALIVMALWGSLFPMIKIGYKAFNINTGSIAAILMFAGLRFTVCGVILVVCGSIRHSKVKAGFRESILPIIMTGLFAVILHYAFTYIGLALTESSKTAILKQLGALFYVCFCFLFVKEEKFSIVKILGAIIGFCGIIAINANGEGMNFYLADLLIISASICTVVSNIYAKKAMQNNSSVIVTGVSQLIGGIVFLLVAFIMGAQLPKISLGAIAVFAYICSASMTAYCLWYYIVKNGKLSNLFIIKFSEPVFACIFGAMLLGENIFRVQYFLAFVLISSGIAIANRAVN